MSESGRELNLIGRLYLWATHLLYDQLAWAYDLVSWVVSLGHWSGWRRKALEHLIGQRVLEVGFGTGELLVEMAGQGMGVVGLDPSPAMHRITRNKLCRRNVRASLVRGISQTMPFADGCFDSIVATFPAEYILDLETMQGVARLLRPADPPTGTKGGRFIIVGAGFYTNSVLLRRAVRLILGVSVQEMLHGYAGIAAAAGLEIALVTEEDKWFSYPVFILQHARAAGALPVVTFT